MTILCTAVILLLRNFSLGLGVLAGSFWNLVNFYLIIILTQALFPKEGAVNRKKLILLFGVKFPVLYGLGYLILRFSNLSMIGILLGFSLLFLVIVARSMGYFLVQNQTVTSGGRK
jgi:hypothetical protein